MIWVLGKGEMFFMFFLFDQTPMQELGTRLADDVFNLGCGSGNTRKKFLAGNEVLRGAKDEAR